MESPNLFAERLLLIMQQYNLNQSELASIAGIHKSTITRYMNGTYTAKQDVIHAIAVGLNISEAWLMGYDVPMEREKQKTSDPHYGINYDDVVYWVHHVATREEKTKLLHELASSL